MFQDRDISTFVSRKKRERQIVAVFYAWLAASARTEST